MKYRFIEGWCISLTVAARDAGTVSSFIDGTFLSFPQNSIKKVIREGFLKGAPVILGSGCHIGDCHYIDFASSRDLSIRKTFNNVFQPMTALVIVGRPIEKYSELEAL